MSSLALLERLDRLAAAATPGPWTVERDNSGLDLIHDGQQLVVLCIDGMTYDETSAAIADFEFIAECRVVVPLLIQAARALEEIAVFAESYRGVYVAEQVAKSAREALALLAGSTSE